jgi:hypothetical protein
VRDLSSEFIDDGIRRDDVNRTSLAKLEKVKPRSRQPSGLRLTIRIVSDPLKQVDDEPEFLESHRLP